MKQERARQAKDIAEENLRLQEKWFQAGLITQKDLTDFQVRLVDAEGAALRALTDYNNATLSCSWPRARCWKVMTSRSKG